MRLLVVSNRLPVSIAKQKGRLVFKESTGGLVSGISAYLDSLRGAQFRKSGYVWVGWPGIAIEDKFKDDLRSQAMSRYNAYPVFLSGRSMEQFYEGFCNNTIWPLFHYFSSYVSYDENYYAHYKCVNQIFCEAVLEVMEPDDIIWVNDYHLMLLPKLLKDKAPNVPVGFFLHIPFPSYELFRTLPAEWRDEILNGILGADLIGFHTHDYTQYFLRCVLRILGYDHDLGNIYLPNRMVKVDTFPMGIDFQKFFSTASLPEIKKEKEKSWHLLKEVTTVLSIDRLDYTKGIINRLLGYELFLEKNPQWQKKVSLVMVVVPSRVGVEDYQKIKKQIDELVGKINGRFGSVDWTPIIYLYKFIPFDPLVALYSASDVALITPLRDGMNLIAKEYVASRPDGTGVLIISEMAGASKELAEAIVINPYNVDEIAAALKTALEMPKEEQVRRTHIMQDRLKRYDVIRWANDFLDQLSAGVDRHKNLRCRFLSQADKDRLVRDFVQAKQRAVLLDYDGTLVPFNVDPKQAKPGPPLMDILTELSSDARTKLVIISGRDKDTIGNWLGSLNAVLIAEHGVWNKSKNSDWKLIKPLDNEWKEKILPILHLYADRLPGAFVEEKEYSVVWHYRRAEPELASIRARELTDDLMNFTANLDVQILQGNKVVEIRCGGVTKGVAAMQFLTSRTFDFILALGDDWTDEELFKVLPDTAYSIKVGMRSSHAKFNLHSYKEVLGLLSELIESKVKLPTP